MADEKGRNKKKKEIKKVERLRLLLGTDLCACGGGDQLLCSGACRDNHTNEKTGRVECGELYRIDHSATRLDSPRKQRRAWKYGRQRETDDNDRIKQYRRDKFERNRS